MSHLIYDLDKALTGFIERFGIEPNGVLMSEETFKEISTLIKDSSLFKNIPIFTCPSSQLEKGKLRFII